jgi:membrane protein implicated in regulation of membrane protease activity
LWDYTNEPIGSGVNLVPINTRRLRFTILVLISQVLLIALAIAWLAHMIVVAANGSVYFIETSLLVLWVEISLVALITLFATAVFSIEVYRLGERRKADRKEGHTSVLTKADSTSKQKRLEKYLQHKN